MSGPLVGVETSVFVEATTAVKVRAATTTEWHTLELGDHDCKLRIYAEDVQLRRLRDVIDELLASRS